MTGFAQARFNTASGSLTVVLKSVNHRALDLRWQYPSGFEAAVVQAEKRIRESVRRGHLDIRVQWDPAADSAYRLDDSLISAYLEAHRRVAERLGDASPPPGAAELLRFPGVFSASSAPTADDAMLAAALLEGLEAALAELNRMRAGEGAALAADLHRRLADVARARATLAGLTPEVEAAVMARLRQRISDLSGLHSSDERLLQEAAMLAERADVSEELTRLEIHLDQFRALLDQGGEIGRKLDFLLQEINREVNTLMSKSSGVTGMRATELGLEMKSELEKMREQVQNIE